MAVVAAWVRLVGREVLRPRPQKFQKQKEGTCIFRKEGTLTRETSTAGLGEVVKKLETRLRGQPRREENFRTSFLPAWKKGLMYIVFSQQFSNMSWAAMSTPLGSGPKYLREHTCTITLRRCHEDFRWGLQVSHNEESVTEAFWALSSPAFQGLESPPPHPLRLGRTERKRGQPCDLSARIHWSAVPLLA